MGLEIGAIVRLAPTFTGAMAVGAVQVRAEHLRHREGVCVDYLPLSDRGVCVAVYVSGRMERIWLRPTEIEVVALPPCVMVFEAWPREWGEALWVDY